MNTGEYIALVEGSTNLLPRLGSQAEKLLQNAETVAEHLSPIVDQFMTSLSVEKFPGNGGAHAGDLLEFFQLGWCCCSWHHLACLRKDESGNFVFIDRFVPRHHGSPSRILSFICFPNALPKRLVSSGMMVSPAFGRSRPNTVRGKFRGSWMLQIFSWSLGGRISAGSPTATHPIGTTASAGRVVLR